jgi:hypothetical protein
MLSDRPTMPNFGAWFAQNAFVICIATFLNSMTFFYVMPKLSSIRYSIRLLGLLSVLLLLSYSMFMWCWAYAGLADPGRIRDDLEARGILWRVVRGDIPPCLRALPICQFCLVPMPPYSHHCRECGACVLRHDHHCGVIGACIGDKNQKSFLLCFLYLFFNGVINFVFCITLFWTEREGFVAALSLSLSGAFGLVLPLFGCCFIDNFMSESQAGPYGLPRRKVIRLLGKRWWQRLIPTQERTTALAWPGIAWESECL